MKIVDTSALTPETFGGFHSQDQLFIYNGLDNCVTIEVLDALRPEVDEPAKLLYDFTRGLQAPAMAMMLKGIKIDMDARMQFVVEEASKLCRLEYVLDRLSTAVWGKPLNPNSPAQLLEFFYRHMGLPEQFKKFRGQRRVSTDRDALEKLEPYFYAGPIVRTILEIRDAAKTLQVLNSGIDADGRLRASFNPAGTETTRWASRKNIRGGGSNLQNITPKLRRIFIADEGYKLAYPDLEQAESKCVAYISGDEEYIYAHDTGDTHTYVARMVWEELPWNGDLKKDRAIAEQPFYRHFTYRDISKRVQHASNYYAKAYTLSGLLKVPLPLMEAAQERYFDKFAGIRRWHVAVAKELQSTGCIVNPLGFRRQFFDRLNDDATLRQAIACIPQSLVAQLMGIGVWRNWDDLRTEIDIMAQVHDAMLYQYPIPREAELIPEVHKRLLVPVPITDINGRTRLMTIGSEHKVGFNWASADPKRETFADGNPGGLTKYKFAA